MNILSQYNRVGILGYDDFLLDFLLGRQCPLLRKLAGLSKSLCLDRPFKRKHMKGETGVVSLLAYLVTRTCPLAYVSSGRSRRSSTL
jgi:hypothetical protein